MQDSWTAWLARWTDAGMIDAATAQRIRAFEAQHAGSTRLRWPILIALGFGGLMVCGGILLFVAANWDALSPAQRFALVLLLVASFHALGAFTSERFPAMSEAMHAVGTVVLGSGIALAGQIFNLEEHWPGGILMWALGAGLGWAILRHSAQMALFAVLTPAWLVSEWIVAVNVHHADSRDAAVAAAGVFLLALTYLSASGAGRPPRARLVLIWIGIAALIVSSPFLAAITYERWTIDERLPTALLAVAWTIAIGAPLGLAFVLRRAEAWPNAIGVLWVIALVMMRDIAGAVAVYAWWALGSTGLVAWGVRDGRVERINLGAVFFAVTVLVFYFSRVMDKLGRSASLVGLGLLFLGGGWALERIRRQMVRKAKDAA
jgi:uncharacterized membrane protein